MRIARENIGEPRRIAERKREQRDKIRIAPQQRQQPRAAVQRGKEAVERDQRLVRIFRARELIDQHRHQFGQVRARELALERAVLAGEPAPHGLADFQWPSEAPLSQLVEGIGVVFGARESERALGFV